MAKKTSVTIKGIGQAQANALKFLNNTIKDRKILDEIGSDLVFQIQARTTAGLEEYKQDPITESTIVSRELLADVNSLNQFAKPKRSNLTLSGQLLGSIRHRANIVANEIVLFLDKRNYKMLPPTKESIARVAGSKPKKKQGLYYAIGHLIMQKPPKLLSNTQIKSDLESQGRRFLFMSEKLKFRLEKNITSLVGKQLSLYNKIKRKLSL